MAAFVCEAVANIAVGRMVPETIETTGCAVDGLAPREDAVGREVVPGLRQGVTP